MTTSHSKAKKNLYSADIDFSDGKSVHIEYARCLEGDGWLRLIDADGSSATFNWAHVVAVYTHELKP